MIVHPNPMIQRKDGTWIDTHLDRVEVRYFQVNFGKHRDRWGVYAARRKGSPMLFSSRHITESQAVVAAQTLANRLYRLRDKKKRKANKPIMVSVPQTELTSMLTHLQETSQLAAGEVRIRVDELITRWQKILSQKI